MNKLLPVLLFLCFFAPGRAWPQNPKGEKPPATPEEYKILEAAYAEDRARALRGVLARYVDELEAMERSLAAAGDSAGAARVKEERDRVRPALGLPAWTEEEAADFALFEDPPVPSQTAAPEAVPANLEEIIRTLMPGGTDAKSATDITPAAAATTKGARRVLKMSQLQEAAEIDPHAGYMFWRNGRVATWTLNDLPPGTYEIVLKYSCDGKKGGGGKVEADFGGTKLTAAVAATGGWNRRQELVIGPFTIKDTRADLKLTALPETSYLMDLAALMVRPAGQNRGAPIKP